MKQELEGGASFTFFFFLVDVSVKLFEEVDSCVRNVKNASSVFVRCASALKS